MSPKVPAAYLKARKDQIIEAACHSFVNKGLDKTTMPDICQAAGLSPGAIYNYFSGKEDIIEACASKSLQRNAGLFASVAGEGNPLIGILQSFFPLLKQKEFVKASSFDLELFAESTRNPKIAKILRASNAMLLAELDTFVKSRQSDGRLNQKFPSKEIARFFIGMYYGLVISKILDPATDIDAAMGICTAVMDGSFSSPNK